MLLHLTVPNYFLRVAHCADDPRAIVVDRLQKPATVLACGGAATARAVEAGQSEAEAFALAADACFVAYDPQADLAFMAEMLEILDGFSPDIEVIGSGNYLLDLGSISVEKAQAEGQALLQVAGGQVGIASQRFVAALAATVGGVQCVAPGGEAQFVAPYPVDLLPVRHEVIRRLNLLGIHQLQQLAALAPSQLTKQFAALGKQLGEWARGVDSTPMHARSIEKHYSTQRDLEVCSDVAYLLHEAQEALTELFALLKKDYKLASALKVLFHLEGDSHESLEIRFASPIDDAGRALKLFKERLEAIQFSRPICSFLIHLDGLVSGYAEQLSLLPLSPLEQRRQGVQRVVQRLEAKAQKGALMQVTWNDRESRIPERRAFLQDLVHPKYRRPLCLPKPARVATGAGGVPAVLNMRAGWIPVLWILETWELDEEWWTQQAILRTYYRVQLQDGSLLRLFRDGQNGRWYRQQV